MTPEQQEAQDQLQIAVENHIRAFRVESGAAVEVTGDWLLVSAVISLDLDNNERQYAYHMGFSGGEQPEHTAYGLLRKAERLLDEGQPVE